MSELTVGTLSGLAANSYEVSIASGSTLDLANAKAASLPTSAIGTGGILQVVSTTKTDAFSTSSTSYTDITGLSASITPRSTSSKIFVITDIGHFDDTIASTIFFRLMRDATAIGISTAGSLNNGSFGSVINTVRGMPGGMTFLDSPNTTSSTTYKVQMGVEGGTGHINRRSDNANFGFVSSITLIEVAG